MQSESICANDIEGLDTDTLIPVELFDNISQHARPQDTLSIVELGKKLLLSAKTGDIESVRELMCRGAPFTTDWLGTSALHFAAQNNHLEVAEVLLRAGISRDARTKVDKTPLHMAAYEGHHEMVQLLLNYGADVDSRDMLKMTPLHWAVERKHVDVMHILLDHGADRTATSKFSKTPVSLALECDRLDLVDILQQERDIVVGIQQPQNNTTELEIATHNLVHLEPESNSRNFEEQKFEISQQHTPQHKHKLSQVSGESERKKQKLMFQQIPISPNNIDAEHEKEFDDIEINAVNNITNTKKYKDITSIGNLNKHFKLLEGIRMIPVDEEESSIVENAMESGRTVVLTEAGKLALNSTKGSPIKHFQVASRGKTPRKVIAIRSDQISSKILNPNSNASTIATRSPNILKRTVDRPGKLFVTTVANATTISAIHKVKTSVSSKEKLISPMKAMLQLDDDIEEITEEDSFSENNEKQITDIAVLTKQLEEARRQADEYRKQLQEKEKEAEIYKQKLKNISAQIASK